jgi:hypothetical protein
MVRLRRRQSARVRGAQALALAARCCANIQAIGWNVTMTKKLLTVLMFVVIAMMAAFATGTGDPPSPPRLPWHVNAYLGFERADALDQHGMDDEWYLQNSLQIDGLKIKLHKQTVLCRGGKTWSSEGDGGAEFFEGEINGSMEDGTAVLRYVACDRCLSQPEAAQPVSLPLRHVSPGVIQLGAVMYRLDAKPYPDVCPREI